MLTRIKRLPVFIANQIAAGEVIERPASVVKELLENAIDANASQINVEIGFGGLNLIKVSDNGSGILADDLPLAIAPHATSKINELADLYAIQSMGFRGEALASISSVSRLIISSKPASQDHAMRLDAVKQELSISARAQGTTIEVHDIFFNAPVRKKFLKSERGEFQAIERMVKRIAMSAPKVAMSLTHNGQLQWQLNSALCPLSMRARITKLLGKKFIDGASYIEIVHAGMRLEGWLGDVTYQRSQNDGVWIYLNSRMVKDKLLSHAIKQAYTSVLLPGRYPVCLLYLTIDPALVDVNVHPTKHEVRFQQARLVHDFIVSEVSRALAVPAMSAESPELTHSLSVVSRPLFQAEEIKRHCDAGMAYSDRVSEAKQIIALDSQFSLLLMGSEVYLADLQALRTHYLLQLLHQEVIPWPNRPLLVPIDYSDSSHYFTRYHNYYSLLQQLGIELDVVDSHTLAVRTLPNVAPQLEIKSFLHTVFSLDFPDLMKCIASLAADLLQNSNAFSPSQQTAFWDYLTRHLADLLTSSGIIKKLSPALCQVLLHA